MRKIVKDNNGYTETLLGLGALIFSAFFIYATTFAPVTNYMYDENYEPIIYGDIDAYIDRYDIYEGIGTGETEDSGENAIRINFDKLGNTYEIYINEIYYGRTSSSWILLTEAVYPGITTDSTTKLKIMDISTGLEETNNLNWIER